MASTECIDPSWGNGISALMEMPVEESVEFYWGDPSFFKPVSLHWYSCPSCRLAFHEAVEVMKSVRHGIERRAMTLLSQICEKHFIEANSSRSAITDPSEFYADRLTSLMIHGEELHESDVQYALCYAVEGLPDFTVRCDGSDESSQRIPLSQCAEFILSLEPKAQSLVFASVLCHEMYYQLYQKAVRKTQPLLFRVDPETGKFIKSENEEYEHPYDSGFIHASIKSAIMSSEVPSEIAYEALHAAASEYLRRFKESIGRTPSGEERSQDQSGRRGVPSSIAVDEFRSDIADSFDSLKAGQNELLRLIERNSRPAAAFEPDIEMQLGSVYRRLEQKTQRLLQIAEYLYDINKSEPNYFHGPVMMMANAYENELIVRIIGRYIMQLLESGTKTYYVDDSTRPLIDRGEPRNLSLGNMGWHLKWDRNLRKWVESIGSLSVDAISRDAGWLTSIRNRAAHQPILERAVADEVRQQMLRSDGILARLHASEAKP